MTMGDLKHAEALRQRAIENHARLRETPAFKDAAALTNKLVTDLVLVLQSVMLMSTRSRDLAENVLVVRTADHLLQSCLAIVSLQQSGMLGPVKRELRFVLELLVKASVIDQAIGNAEVKARLLALNDGHESFADLCNRLQIANLCEIDASTFRKVAKSLYRRLSKIVHASMQQITEDLDRFKRGIHFGFETVAMLNDMNAMVRDVLDLGVPLVLQSVGPALAGDIYVQILDDLPAWVFHRTRLSQRFSRFYDYKAERLVRRPTKRC
jgi:hypothetical protein